MHVLLPHQPPEVSDGLVVGLLSQDELGQAEESWHPARVDIIRTILIRNQRKLDTSGVNGQEVKALVLELVAGEGGGAELGLAWLDVSDLGEVSLQQLPGGVVRGVVALETVDVTSQVGGLDVCLSTPDGFS